MSGAILIAVAIALGSGASIAQQPPPQPTKPDSKKSDTEALEKASLEELLNRALKDNPDIRVAETKVREAEAELNRARMQVMQKVVTFRHDLEAASKTVDEAHARCQTLLRLQKTGTAIPTEEMRAAELTLLRYKAEKGKLEAELPYLLGKQPPRNARVTLQNVPLSVDVGFPLSVNLDYDAIRLNELNFDISRSVTEDVATKIRKALDTPVQVNFQDKSVDEMLKELEKQAPGAHFVLAPLPELARPRFTLKLQEKLPLASALQAIGDLAPDLHCFVVRDYGILFTTPRHAPAGAIRVHDFWTRKQEESKDKAKAAKP